MLKKRMKMVLPVVLLVSVVFALQTFPHCQIPCGIYNDETQFDIMNTHVTSLEKGMNQIKELSAAGDKNYNQIVRWVENKDQTADDLSHIVTYYFLTQRIKPVEDKNSAAYKDYTAKLEMLHQMLIASMKCKQTTDLENVEILKDLLKQFKEAYFAK